MSEVFAERPRQALLFAVNDVVADSMKVRIKAFISELGNSRQWLISPPEFVDELEAPANPEKGDLPLETVGGYVELYSAWPPCTLPREIDQRCLDDVKALIERLKGFSKETGMEFDLELAGTFVGSIESGQSDRNLTDGFIGEWERRLSGSSRELGQ